MDARTSPRSTLCRAVAALGLGAALAVGCDGPSPDAGGAGQQAATGGETTKSVTQARPASPAKPKMREVQPVTLAAGTTFDAALGTSVATNKSHAGDPVTLRTTEAVVVGGATAVPAGTVVHGTVTHVRAAGRVKGAAELTLRFTELEFPNGKRVEITCEPYRQVVKGDGRESAAEIGGATAVGGVLGGVLGGKDDVLKGAAIGAAVGTGVAVATKGDQIVLPAGRTLQVRLAAPVTLVTGATS